MFHNTESLKVVGPDAPLVVKAGEVLVLPCSIQPKTSAVDMTVEWFRLDAADVFVHLYENHRDINEKQDQIYRGRTALFREELQKGNTSLRLSDVRVSDEGAYKCFIKDKSWYDDITVQVTVEESLKVVGPEAPLVVETGEVLVLPCSIQPNTSAVDMTVEWFRLDAADRFVHLYKNHRDIKEKQDQFYRGRTALFREELQKGNTSLRLSDVRVSDEGAYKCFIKDKSWYDDITVQVTVEESLKVVGPDAPLVVEVGEVLVLPCSIQPNTSAVDMTVEWFRLDAADRFVHLYENHRDINEKQDQSYRGRTALFREELQKGNTSLRLSDVRVSDEGAYKCLIKDKSWYDDITVQVTVEGKEQLLCLL
ncbi:hypothetical protein AMEX_G11372 [Astyanax mexicanus]|uniref:Ig-like domain-containing protein n=1 Tax=Astyanax mexicanus TaxID=7994 RepID=A0A8T2LYM3_ASTMX|nr:hypothetical protein AMEX_G11372 [Astyanax mexicanus]